MADALHLALRDVQLKARFASLRAEGLMVDTVVDRLHGLHLDDSDRSYYLSDEHVRSIFTRKADRSSRLR